MSDDVLVRLLIEARKRLVATLMGHAEREIFPKLSAAEQREFRQRTLAAVDVFADLMRDVIKVNREDMVRNDAAIELIERVHRDHGTIMSRLPGA